MSVRPRPEPTEAEVHDAAALLGVAPGASSSEIKRAWRAAVRVTHPDRVDGQARRAAEHLAAVLNEARDVLLAVAGTRPGPVPFGGRPEAVPAPPTGSWEAAVPPGVDARPVADLPRPVAPAPPPTPADAVTVVSSGRARPVREAIGVIAVLALLGAAAVLVVYQLLGGLLLR